MAEEIDLEKEAKEAEPTQEASAESLKALMALAEKQLEIEDKLQKNGDERKELNADLEKICGGWRNEGTLPTMLEAIGMKSFKLEDGREVTLKKELKAPSMAATSEKREIVLKWLRDKGHSDIIKGNVTSPFSPGEKKLEALKKAIQEIGMQFDEFETVAPGTLVSLLEELIEAAEEVPMNELGVFEFKRTKIKALPKKKGAL